MSKISILTGGGDKPYALGLLEALISKGLNVEFIGNDEMSKESVIFHKNVHYLNLRGDQSQDASMVQKVRRILKYYLRLFCYPLKTNAKVFHILWFNKFILFDRTILNLYYKLIGKKLVFTAHNVDEKERDGGNNILNLWSLKMLYGLVDQIFVHTEKMKKRIVDDFSISPKKISVIPFGINNTLPQSNIDKSKSRLRLGLNENDKVMLFFGNIAPYKGLEYAVKALGKLTQSKSDYRLIIAGRIKNCQKYWEDIESYIENHNLKDCILTNTNYIPDEEVEVYFKASDVLLLPYKFIYQSGVLFLSYNFGLPVIATDVGSLREDIIEGKTGLICQGEDPDDMAQKIEHFFNSDLFERNDEIKKLIVAYANEHHSWEKVADRTIRVYQTLTN